MRPGAKAIAALDSLPVDRRPFLCDISLWEVATLVERGRLTFDVPLDDWFEAAAHARSVRLLPVSSRVAPEIAALPDSFHRDPAEPHHRRHRCARAPHTPCGPFTGPGRMCGCISRR